MFILVLNSGSSSLKYQVIDVEKERVLAKGLVSRIGDTGSKLKQQADEQNLVIEQDIQDHAQAIQLMLDALLHAEKGALKSLDEIGAVGHRVLHGGERFTKSVLVNEDVKTAIKENIPLGPLHNPANLLGIEACEKLMPNIPNVAVFDTAFHQTMPPKAYMYGIPYEYYEKLHIRRYGFHGTSHRYVSKRACDFLGLDPQHTRMITCHLGNGSSLAAICNGKCLDTSMGLTPLEGVLMGSRSGSIDPAVVQYIANSEHLTVDETLSILNRKSGLLGIAGYMDMIDVSRAAERGEKRAALALEMLCYSVKKYVGAYAAAMGGVDAIIFTGGIGENSFEVRQNVMCGFEYLGARIDLDKNNGCRREALISTEDSKVKIAVIPTNEELLIAQDTASIVESTKKA